MKKVRNRADASNRITIANWTARCRLSIDVYSSYPQARASLAHSYIDAMNAASLVSLTTLFFTVRHLLRILNDSGLETLGVLDVDGLDVGVQLLLGTLLVVSLTADADAEAEWNALDAGLPDLLVQLRVEANVGGALRKQQVSICSTRKNQTMTVDSRK